jgi:hypothetical protein
MATVAIVDHDPTWPEQFQRLAAVAAEDWAAAGRPPPAAVGPGGPDDQWQATGPPRSSTSPSSDTNRHS